MDKNQLIDCLAIILCEERWQTNKGRTIKTCLITQRQAINVIAKALNVEKLSIDEINVLSNS